MRRIVPRQDRERPTMKTLVVQQGDCISSIAEEYGFFWRTIWNDPQNAELKRKRKDPNLLMPGDEIFIPDKTVKTETGATEQRHKFVKKGVPAKLRIKILKRPTEERAEESRQASRSGTDTDPIYEQPEQNEEFREEPWTNCPYILEIDGNRINGTSDGQGFVEAKIPPRAQSGRLIMSPRNPDEMIIELSLGTLNPPDEISGVKQRLSNLGFDCGDDGNEVTEAFAEALQLFQECYGLRATGEVDDATRDKLTELCA
jgi:hypothetical protein